MQFDGSDLNPLDPRARIKHFYFGSFNVHLHWKGDKVLLR